MNKHICFLALFFLLIGCKRNDLPIDPCSKLVNGVYQYPQKLTDTTMTPEEKVEFWNVPENVLPCLKTDGLLETCLNYPFMSLYMLSAGCCGLQSGYELVKSNCRGFSELEKRPDALDVLIARYKSIDTVNYNTELNPLAYGGYNFYTYNLEAILAQQVFLKNALITQKIELLTELIVKQNYRENKEVFYFIEGPAYVMARIMYYDNYEPLIQEYNQNSVINGFVIYGYSFLDNDSKLTIISLANDYLNILKAK